MIILTILGTILLVVATLVLVGAVIIAMLCLAGYAVLNGISSIGGAVKEAKNR